MQNLKNIKKLDLTIPQAHAFINMKQKNYWEWSRGSGKSTALAYGIRQFVTQMPRASFFLVGSTYSQILSRTLPSTIEGLEMFNLYQDVDYVVGRCGKKQGFDMPFQPPNQWNNIIHWANGTIFQLVSLDNPNTGRGLNSYGGIGDESTLLDPAKLYNNVKTTNRAQKEIFKGCSMLGAEIYASSTAVNKKGKWFTDMEEEAKKRPDMYYFSKATAFWNPHIRKSWFDEMKAEAPSELIYNAEILNIRPKEITDGFYANLNSDKHYYNDHRNSYLEGLDAGLFKSTNDSNIIRDNFNSNQDNDVLHNEPLIVSLDFGVFNSLVVSQTNGDEYRVLKSMWVKSPKLLDDLLVEQFIPYYRPHQNKTIYLYGGHDGNMRTPNHQLTLFEQVRELLTKHGWTVLIMSKGAAATHFDKYLLLNAMLKERVNLPKIRINESNNADLIIALERSEAVESLNGVDKNKKDERNKEFPQQHATHLTDAFDIPIVTMYNDRFKGMNSFTSEFQIGIS
jgi:hypothetical protein